MLSSYGSNQNRYFFIISINSLAGLKAGMS